jgi:hypothetical protein
MGNFLLRHQHHQKHSIDLTQSLQKSRNGFCRNQQTHSKIAIESKGPPNSQNNAKKEEQIWRTHISLFQKSLPSYGNQNSVVLA